ncbi:MAG: hypothetical protein OEY13_15270 [Gammaproteobacteria bacterium]|nr:hypothetical protein [Gammaproteobacteria bacterium]
MSRAPQLQTLQAVFSSSLTATLGTPRPLLYDHGAHPLEDLPAHVRAASSIRRQGHRLVILQDDVSALAVLDPATGSTQPILLPAGPNGARVFDDERGNKKFKLDLEACIVLPDGRLVALGSGSSPQREKIVTVAATIGAMAQQFSGSDLYASLRVHAAQRGARLNIEGAVLQGRWLRLLQRGHGKRGFEPWNAILDVSLDKFVGWLDGRNAVPPVRRVLEIHLGEVAGVPFGFTDAAVTDDGRVAFLACAEDTEDALIDGPVMGCRFGWLDADDRAVVMTDVVEGDGQPTRLKLEGIETRAGNGTAFDVVADMDRGDQPGQIAELVVRD